MTPDNGVLAVHATLRNGDVFSKQDNREAERERYIGRQVRRDGLVDVDGDVSGRVGPADRRSGRPEPTRPV